MADLIITRERTYTIVKKKINYKHLDSACIPNIHPSQYTYDDWYIKYHEYIDSMCVSLFDHVCEITRSEGYFATISKEQFCYSLSKLIYKHSSNKAKRYVMNK
jgi:hypothetical protein